jgi:hypothetical protein
MRCLSSTDVEPTPGTFESHPRANRATFADTVNFGLT